VSLHVPDILTAGNSEKYTVSIRLSPDGLSFTGINPLDKDSFFYEEIKIDQTKRYIQAIKDLFFAHPFFSFTYKQVFVVCANRQYTFVPETVFVEKQKDAIMAFVFSAPDEKTLHAHLDELESEILFNIQPDVYEFFSRSLLRPTFTHSITHLLNQWRRQNLISFPKQLFVALHEDIIDVACFDKGTLLFINSFHFDDPDDILYYIMYVWKQTGLDQQNDVLVLYANPRIVQTMKTTLQTYLSQIEFVQPRWTDENVEVPPDITALFRCES
jgi:hypothetical protein